MPSLLMTSPRGSLQGLKSTAPKVDPWGSPLWIPCFQEEHGSKLTKTYGPVRWEENQFKTPPPDPPFILYLNNFFFQYLNQFKFITFADDTNLFCSGPDREVLWTTVEKVFGGVRANCETQLYRNGVEVESVCETKFLVVILEHTLSWKPNIEYIKQK